MRPAWVCTRRIWTWHVSGHPGEIIPRESCSLQSGVSGGRDPTDHAQIKGDYVHLAGLELYSVGLFTRIAGQPRGWSAWGL